MSLKLDKSRWTRVRFGDVAVSSKEKVDPTDGSVDRYVAGEHMDTDDLRIRRWGDVSEKDLGPAFHRRFRPGQVLYGSRRTYLRKVSAADFDGVCANTTFVVETGDHTILLQKFLPFVMSSEPFHAHAIGESKGSVNPYVNWSDIAKFEFDLPPLDEQARIADLLWAVDHQRESAVQLCFSLRGVFLAQLAELWQREQSKTIGSIGNCVTGSTPSKSRPDYWEPADIPFYTPTQIGHEAVMMDATQAVSSEGAKAGRILPSNAVAVACIGGDLGKSAVVVTPGISNQQITAVTGLSSDDAFALQALLSHPAGRQRLKSRETTTIVRKLNKSDLMKVEVPWPEDRVRLHSIVGTGHRTLRECQDEVEALKSLRATLSRQIFGGH